MPRKPQTDFSIDLSPTTEPSDGERSPPASPVPQPKAKKPYNFSEARRQALERGRQKRAANLKRQREEREAQTTTQRTGGPPLVLNSEMARAFVLSVRSSGRAAPPSGRAFALSVLGNGPSVRPLLLRSRSLFAAHVPCLLA